MASSVQPSEGVEYDISRLNPLPHHNESSALVSASPERVFALIDDHERLSSHMSQSSWRMGGGRMKTVLDERRGQTVGSHIRVSGRILGLELSLNEVVTEREPPTTKVWGNRGLSQTSGYRPVPDGV